jgi:protocatechuate 3,4-dioxygenase beta subunit
MLAHMSRGWIALIVAAVACAACLTTCARGSVAPTRESVAPRIGGAQPDSGATSVVQHPATQRNRKPAWDDVDIAPAETTIPDRSTFLDVTVVRADGCPAVGATIDVQVVGAFGAEPVQPAVAVRTADASGCGTFDFGPRVADPACRIVAWLGDEAATDFVWATFDQRTKATLRLAPSVMVRGRVVDDEGRVVPGAVVTAQATHPDIPVHSRSVGARGEITTDSNGSFALPLPASEALQTNLQFDARAPGFECESIGELRWKRAEDVAKGVEIRMFSVVHVRGRCVDARGAPIADAEVELVQDKSTTARTGPDGRFDLGGLRRKGGDFVAECDDAAPTRLAGVSGRRGDVDLGDVVLREGGVVRGVVVDVTGKPVAEAGLTLWNEGHIVGDGCTDGEGWFVLKHVGDGEHDLVVLEKDPPHGAMPVMTKVRGIRAGGADLRVVLDCGRRIRFQFVDGATNKPALVKGATIRWRVSGSLDPPESTTLLSTPTSVIRLEVPEVGTYELFVSVSGFGDTFEAQTCSGVAVSADRETIVDVPLRRAR